MSTWPEPDSALAGWLRFVQEHPWWSLAIGVVGLALLITERCLAIQEMPDPRYTASTDDGDEDDE